MSNNSETSTGNVVVEVKDVHKSFKDVHAVNGVNLKIHKGQFVALLGPNGAGKTTLVEMIEGIQQPDTGDISLAGKRWKGNEDELHQLIGLSLQETRFIDKLTVKETLELFSSFYPNIRNSSERVKEVIGLIGLNEKTDSYTVNLSGGQRQKLAIGISLLNNPQILLLDEPTTGLDPNARREIWGILLKLKELSQTSLILTTHYMEEAEQLCDYIIIIDKGKILLEGNRDDLLKKDDEKIIEFALDTNDRQVSFSDSMNNHKIVWDDKNNKGTVILNNLETELPDFLNYLKQKNLPLKNFESRKKTLDDLFTSLTGRHLHENN
ncbi:MAG: ABC transporter ATP-binding protein [Ignavibacteriaceae bacterium]